MPKFTFPTQEQIGHMRRTSAKFTAQVQELLDKMQEVMVDRGPGNEFWGYLQLPPGTPKDVAQTVCDTINGTNDGRDWVATLGSDEGRPVLAVQPKEQ